MSGLEVAALFRKYAGEMANLDTQQNDAQQAYSANVKTLGEGRKRDLRTLQDNFAGKGLTHSGINLQENVNLNKTYDEGQARADQEQKRLMTELARKRLLAQEDYDLARARDSFSPLTEAIG